MGNSSWRARARLHRVWPKVAAVAGLSLVASMTTLTPAQAGLLDDITDPVTDVLDPITDPVTGEIIEPVVDTVTGVVSDPGTGDVLGIVDPVTGDLLLAPLPDISAGTGTLFAVVDGVLTELCDSAEDVCDQVPIEDLVDEAAVILKAVPADPGSIPAWDPDTCPAFIADICMIDLDDLAGDTPLAPIVAFLPVGSGDADEAPDTEITSPDPQKQKKAHTFTFVADPPSPTARFECKLEVAHKSPPAAGEQRSHDWQPCADPSGSQTYENLGNGTYLFGVAAVDGPETDPVTDATPATQSWTVALPPEVPETRIVAGPKNRSFVVTPRATFRFRSTVEDSRFQCWYDDLTNACDAGRFTWGPRMLKPGQHTFKVAAMANKTQDFTPATRRFHIPFDDRALRPVNQWQRKKQRGHVRNTYSVTSVTGAALVTRRPQKFRRVVLVADKGRGFGTVKVFKGKQLLREVDLHAKKKLVKGKVIPVKRFKGKLRAGKIRVVVTSAGKPVRIDGLGVARR